MFKSLKFATKIGLLPTLAGVSFIAILTVLLVTGRQNAEMLVSIQQGYYASLELNRKLYEDLSGLHGAYQDAASMADLEYMSNANDISDQFIATLIRGQNNKVVDVAPLKSLQDEFVGYVSLSQSTVQSIIDGTGDMSVYSNMQVMSNTYDKMVGELNLLTSRDKQDVTNAIATAQGRQSFATMILAAIAATSLLLLIGASIFIIRTASQSVNTTVEGINALASGDFSKEFTAATGDEMGQMVSRVTHVTHTVNSVTNEIERLVDAIRDGQLHVRGEAGNFQGAYARVIENINELIEAFVRPIEMTASYVERISHGDIPPPIEDEYRGDFNQTKENLNTLIHTMSDLIDQVANMTSAAKAGDLEQRGRPDEFAGAWRNLVEGINNTLDAVTSPLQEMSQAMSAMAQGDLTHKSDITYEGEFAKLQSDIHLTVAKLTEVINEIKASGDSATSVANELSIGNHSLRQRTDAQASSLRETAEAMSEMTVAVKQNAGSAHRAKERVSEASEKARKGGAVVQKAVHAMDDVNAASVKIADIINVIDEIAFQTNLLALNAAVEAARAGSEGRGFAVVASEVRNLAGRSATAAKEINDLIQDTVKKVEEGSRLVHESGQTLNEIVDAVIDVDEIVAEITESSQTQATNIDSVSETVTLMDSMTKENAELADAAVQSSTLMGQEANRLTQMTSFFVTENGGHVESGVPENDSNHEVDSEISASGTAA